MNHEMTASPAGVDDTRPYADASPMAGAEALIPDDDVAGPDVSGETDDLPDDGEGALAEVDYEGLRYQVPRPLKDALLRHADYTRKTMELADQRRALAASQADLDHAREMTAAEFRTASRIGDIEDDLARLAQVDWAALHPDDPELHEARQIAAELAQEHAALSTQLTEHHHRKAARHQQDAARAREVADAAMAREISGWSPERRHMLESFAISQGIPEDGLGFASAPELRILHLAHIGARHLDRQRAAHRGAIRPVSEVGGGAGAGTSDPSRMTMAQYRAWRAKQS